MGAGYGPSAVIVSRLRLVVARRMGLAREAPRADSPGPGCRLGHRPAATQGGADDENLGLAVANFAGLIVEGIAVRSMLSLSQEYVKADPADVGLFHAPGTLIRSVRNSAHQMNLLVSGGSLFVLYAVLFRFALIPRALSASGLATAALPITGAMIPLSGYRTVMQMFMPSD